MRRVFFIWPVTFLLVSCHSKERKENPSPFPLNYVVKTGDHSLALLPFKGVDSILLYGIKTGIEKQLAVPVTVLEEAVLPPNAFYKPRQRYIADSLLVFLTQINNGRFEKILGITTKDISTRKDPHENWGILGLGSCPGVACVISSFRAGKTKVSRQDFIRRMVTLALHETGHTYGLEHCPVANCLMKDAEGKMNLDDGDSYCSTCRNYLAERGVLK